MIKLSEYMESARDDLAQGWVQDTLSQGRNVCALGSLKRAAMRHLSDGGPVHVTQAKQLLDAKGAEMFPELVARQRPFKLQIQQINDATGRQQQEMLDIFDKCIIELQEKGL